MWISQRSLNDSYRTSKRPPKLYQKAHDISYNRSFNQSIPHEISFRQQTFATSTVSSSSTTTATVQRNASLLLNSVYKQDRPESYFEQCFDVLARIGEGSFGEVFKVRSKEDGRLYAIKKSKQLYRGETARQECINEVRHHEKFSEHEHCITLHKAWEQNDLLYMQLELCRSNLETFAVQNDDLPEERVWDILVDLLLALKGLHDQNLIHLDIKLENIMISQDNVCKLGDFGLVMDLNQVSWRSWSDLKVRTGAGETKRERENKTRLNLKCLYLFTFDQQPNIPQPREGDSRYIAPELLQGCFTKAADIFSLGITILELACNLDLPKNGYLWHKLRCGVLPDEFIRRTYPQHRTPINYSNHLNQISLISNNRCHFYIYHFAVLSIDLQNIIKWMLDPDPFKRPDVNAILATDKIKKILARRKMVRPFNKIVSDAKQFARSYRLSHDLLLQTKATRNVWSSMYTFRIYICNLLTSIMCALKLSRKRDLRKDSIAQTSTPQTMAAESSDDSFLQLEDSNIDFDESPSNRSHNKSFLKPLEMQIVNSTPLNHYNSQGNYRRNRSELSRTSLVWVRIRITVEKRSFFINSFS